MGSPWRDLARCEFYHAFYAGVAELRTGGGLFAPPQGPSCFLVRDYLPQMTRRTQAAYIHELKRAKRWAVIGPPSFSPLASQSPVSCDSKKVRFSDALHAPAFLPQPKSRHHPDARPLTCAAQGPAARGVMRPFSPGATSPWIAAASLLACSHPPLAPRVRVATMVLTSRTAASSTPSPRTPDVVFTSTSGVSFLGFV